MSLGSRDEDKEISVENIFKNGWNISKFSETHKFTASQNSAILKKEKLREKKSTHTQQHHNQTAKNQRLEKIF